VKYFHFTYIDNSTPKFNSLKGIYEGVELFGCWTTDILTADKMFEAYSGMKAIACPWIGCKVEA
jgi:hypothetical protein